MSWQPLQPAGPLGATAPAGLVEGEVFVRAWKNDAYTVWEYDFAAWNPPQR